MDIRPHLIYSMKHQLFIPLKLFPFHRRYRFLVNNNGSTNIINQKKIRRNVFYRGFIFKVDEQILFFCLT